MAGPGPSSSMAEILPIRRELPFFFPMAGGAPPLLLPHGRWPHAQRRGTPPHPPPPAHAHGWAKATSTSELEVVVRAVGIREEDSEFLEVYIQT